MTNQPTRSSRRMRKAVLLKELKHFDELLDYAIRDEILRGKLNIFIEKNIVHKFNLTPANEKSINYLNAKLKTLLDIIVYQLPETSIDEDTFKEIDNDLELAKYFIFNWTGKTIQNIFAADLILIDLVNANK